MERFPPRSCRSDLEGGHHRNPVEWAGRARSCAKRMDEARRDRPADVEPSPFRPKPFHICLVVAAEGRPHQELAAHQWMADLFVSDMRGPILGWMRLRVNSGLRPVGVLGSNPTRSTFPPVHTGLLHAIETHK